MPVPLQFTSSVLHSAITILHSLLIIALTVGTLNAASADRAIWMWEEPSYRMVEDRSFATESAAFLRSKKIGTVYLYADAFKGRNLIETNPGAYRLLIRQLHRNGLHVYALLGSAYLHTEEYVLPERRTAAVSMLQRVLTYNAAASRAERFDGINLDIEPHILDQWSSQKEKLLEQFLDLGETFMSLKRASGQSLAIGPAIPFWLDGIELEWKGQKKPVSEHVIDTYDYVALMAYRDRAEGHDGIVYHSVDEMIYAEKVHKRVVVGVDIGPGEPQKISFDHLTEKDLERELGLAGQAFRDKKSFGGFVLHHFETYRKWLARAGG
ncbi:MAG TPA: hypothetical protein VHL58_17355 [Thermoanaerobaculia bacterium]|nr:hypothetical protein [Thermoanaerobaculia bacterium]